MLLKRVAVWGALALLLPAVPARAADWQVDPAKSHLTFTGTQAGESFQGRFTRWTAAIAFDPAHPADGHAEVVIETASAQTGDPQKDEALPQSDWFNAKAYPQARFVAKTFRQTGPGRYEAVGSLTIKGISHDVVLPFTLALSGAQASVSGTLSIDRTAFHVGEGAWSATTFVGGTVGLDIALIATRR
ncbi:protein YceI [mine drainage metagenome]|uniref:Protein YceI n=1 Tax=mine drainage metagenome TaxID=410659 RepID=A0A1J5T5R6_9ZZZZ